MKVNLSPTEYALVCRVADYYGSYPAQLVHEWTVVHAIEEYQRITGTDLTGRVHGDGMLGTGGEPIPSQASRPVHDGKEG